MRGARASWRTVAAGVRVRVRVRVRVVVAGARAPWRTVAVGAWASWRTTAAGVRASWHAVAALAAVAVLAVLAVLTGCGAAGDGARAGTGGAQAPSAAVGAVDTGGGLAAGQDGGDGGDVAGGDGGGPGAGERTRPPSPGPVLPDSRLTPATGSFTAREKKYLSGRVPEGTDPAAVLQLGQEACERLARTAKADRDAAVAALIAGDIPGARDAVDGLCPDQKALLRAAASGFPDGTRKHPAAGTYRALTTSTAACTWQALGPADKVLASGPAPGTTGHVTARIPPGTRSFTSTGCYAWLPA